MSDPHFAMIGIHPGWFHVFSVVVGLVVGSFINVIVVRMPRGKSIVTPRSHCPHCKKKISAFHNIPVLSYLLLRGKCRNCGERISIRYPVIEILVALLFLASEMRFGVSPLLVFRDWPFLAILVAIAFIDLEHRIIPDQLSLGGLGLGLITSWADPHLGVVGAFMGAGFGFGFFYLFSWAYYKATGRIGLGGGDVKFLTMLGAYLGIQGVFSTILISSISGSFVGLGYALISGKKNLMKVSIPYGPFLVLGGLYYYLLGDVLWFQFTIPM